MLASTETNFTAISHSETKILGSIKMNFKYGVLNSEKIRSRGKKVFIFVPKLNPIIHQHYFSAKVSFPRKVLKL